MNQRRRLAARAKRLGRKVLAQVVTIVTPPTLLALHRGLIAKNYDGAQTESRAARKCLHLGTCGWRIADVVPQSVSDIGHDNAAVIDMTQSLSVFFVRSAPAIVLIALYGCDIC